MIYVSPIDNCCFWCNSDAADFAYVVECLSESDFEKATEIAERELTNWCQAPNEDSSYWYKGFVEVVQDALNEEGIQANYYVNIDLA